MTEALLTSYEEVPYLSKPLYPTHPDCQATVATLFGMSPAAPQSCRVLELGCADGGNLIPMAEALPNSSFLGIDLSPRQIADGQAVVDALGLTNVELRALSILDIDDDFGQFDFIICHGVYSWVPPPVQDKILSICARNLAPQGTAYISYNTYPGWHGRAVVRDMMNFHSRQFEEPATRVQQARALLEFVNRSVPNPESAYAKVMQEEIKELEKVADYYVFHEHLEDINQPVYFHQFMERASQHSLQYLGEAWFHTRLDDLPQDVQEALQKISADLIHLEQYVDFLRNRTFRRTLLCHDHVQLNREPSPRIVRSLNVSALLQPVNRDMNVRSVEVAEFRSNAGAAITTNVPLMKAALLCLYDVWPHAIGFGELLDKVQAALEETWPTEREADLLAMTLMQCYIAQLAALHVWKPSFVTEVRDRPVASPVARWMADTQSMVTNRRHRLVQLSDVEREVLRRLDGTHDRQALERLTPEGLEPILKRLAMNALLVRSEGC